jgi:hypothetical protein
MLDTSFTSLPWNILWGEISFEFCADHYFNKNYYILLKMNTHFLTKNVQHVFTKPLKTLRAQINASYCIFKITILKRIFSLNGEYFASISFYTNFP